MKRSPKTITLYDFGGGIIILMMFGLPFGVVIDYLWNRFVLSQTLRRLITGSADSAAEFALSRTGSYALFITIIGLLIDWGYYELIWNVERGLGGTNTWVPTMSLTHQLTLILLPMALLWLANFLLSGSYLKLGRKHALMTAALMAFLTSPWIVPVFPYIAGWTG